MTIHGVSRLWLARNGWPDANADDEVHFCADFPDEGNWVHDLLLLVGWPHAGGPRRLQDALAALGYPVNVAVSLRAMVIPCSSQSYCCGNARHICPAIRKIVYCVFIELSCCITFALLTFPDFPVDLLRLLIFSQLMFESVSLHCQSFSLTYCGRFVAFFFSYNFIFEASILCRGSA